MQLELWHGTNQDFTSFSEAKLGLLTSNPASRAAFFFAAGRDTAICYARYAAEKIPENNDKHEREVERLNFEACQAMKSGNHDEYERLICQMEEMEHQAIYGKASGARVLKCQISTTNPFVVQGSDRLVITDLGGVLMAAHSNGHDALIIENIVDTPYGDGEPDMHVAVFSSSQIEILETQHLDEIPEPEDQDFEMA